MWSEKEHRFTEQGVWKLISEVGWDKSDGATAHHAGRQARFQAMWDSKGLFPSTQTQNQKCFGLSLIYPSLALCWSHRDGVKVTSFVRTISYYLPCLSWAGSAGGNRWCVWQVLDTRQRSAWARLDGVDTCPDHKVQTSSQVRGGRQVAKGRRLTSKEPRLES